MAEGTFQVVESAGTPILNGHDRAPAATTNLPPGAGGFSPTAVAAPEFVLTPLEVIVSRTARTVDWNDLYQASVGRSGMLVRARLLLSEGEKHLGSALDYLREGEVVRSDYEVTLFQGALPELFCCNSLSEGFAALVVTLRSALKNRQGDALTAEQLQAVLESVSRLRKELFLKYEVALDLIDSLEKAGLNTDPSISAPLTALLIDENENAASSK